MSIGIGLGLAGFPFSGPQAFFAWIDLCEEHGIDSVWVSERLVSSQATLEPLAAFGAIAGRTQRLKFGMNAIVLPHRDPLVLAKMCATLDYLSSGRLLPVFGVGAETAPEFRATGRSPRGRGGRSDEMLQIMARLWDGERVTFEGKHFSYHDAVIAPLPVQQPLPRWIGGNSDAAIRRTALYGTGWLGGIQAVGEIGITVAKIKAAAAEAGRTIDDDHYGAGFAFRFGSFDEPVVQQQMAGLARLGAKGEMDDYFVVGDEKAIAAHIEKYIGQGISKFVLRPMGATDDEVLHQTQELAEAVIPQFKGR
jgi:probable F420-dependent oxidoreductase